MLQAQTKDSLLLQQQSFKINDSVTYTYNKPRYIDLIRYIPNDLVDFGKFTIQKENLKWDALVLSSTLAFLPFDQKLSENAEEFGGRLQLPKMEALGIRFRVFHLLQAIRPITMRCLRVISPHM